MIAAIPFSLVTLILLIHTRFSNNTTFHDTDPRIRGTAYAKECTRLLDWNDISLTTIQACVLLGAIAITDGNSAVENVYYALACRMAQLLDLPNCKVESRVEREVNIRSLLPLQPLSRFFPSLTNPF